MPGSRWQCAALVALASGGAVAQEGERPDEAGVSATNDALDNELTPELAETVTRGLEWLASQQGPDGAWDAGRYGKNVAITSLACLAFMADGHLPGRGRYGEHVERGLRFILDNVAENGLITSDASHGPMYGHGFAALFVGEVYGMTQGGPDTRLAARTHETLVKAVRLIERTQNEEGGWRYNPVPYDADVSVTICQIMALRSARNAGIEVDKNVIDKAVEYVRRLQNGDGGWRYQAGGGTSAWPRSAAGLASLYYAGIYEDEALDRGLTYLQRTATPGGSFSSRTHYFYGHYYAVQAMFLAGGDYWGRWWP
ncbi:MAG: prenyltransferase/squalene oxidase repeat-containing protein, partial [Planctomycetota bacterium]